MPNTEKEPMGKIYRIKPLEWGVNNFGESAQGYQVNYTVYLDKGNVRLMFGLLIR